MTYIEWMKINHPEEVDECCPGGVCGCPQDYGLKDIEGCPRTDVRPGAKRPPDCYACWRQDVQTKRKYMEEYHPERIYHLMPGGVMGCPHDYGLKDIEKCIGTATCKACWDEIIIKEEETCQKQSEESKQSCLTTPQTTPEVKEALRDAAKFALNSQYGRSYSQWLRGRRESLPLVSEPETPFLEKTRRQSGIILLPMSSSHLRSELLQTQLMEVSKCFSSELYRAGVDLITEMIGALQSLITEADRENPIKFLVETEVDRTESEMTLTISCSVQDPTPKTS